MKSEARVFKRVAVLITSVPWIGEYVKFFRVPNKVTELVTESETRAVQRLEAGPGTHRDIFEYMVRRAEGSHMMTS